MWEVKYTSTGNPNVPFSFLAGDGSSISIPATSITTTAGNFTVKVRVGRCNSLITLAGGVTVVQDLNSATAITGFPACRLVTTPSTTNETFTINTLNNVNYTITVPAPWTISPASDAAFSGNGSPKVITITNIDRNAGNIIIRGVGTGSASCFGTQTAVKTLTRRLVAGTTTGLNQLQGCLTPNGASPVTATLTLTNAPVGSTLNWTLPSGWTATGPAPFTQTGTAVTTIATAASATLTLSAPAGTTSGLVSVNSDGCTGTDAVVSRTVTVPGSQGCTYSLTRINARTFALSGSSASCTPDEATDPGTQGIQYTWTAPGQTPPATDNPAITFPATVSNPSLVTVTIVDPSQCLQAAYSQSLRPAPTGGQPGVQPGSSVSNPAARLLPLTIVDDGKARLVAFPNPADGRLHVAFTEQASEVVLTLTDATGRRCLRQPAADANTLLDVHHLPAGRYLLRAELPGGQVLTQPVLVQH